VPACVPPLVVLFLAVRGGAYLAAALAFTVFMIPAAYTLLLAATSSDLLFRVCMANADVPRPEKLSTKGLDIVRLYTLRRRLQVRQRPSAW
jgi:hypothetical protein